MRGSDCIAQAVHCALLSLHLMCILTHTEKRKRRNCAGYGVDKDSDPFGMKIIWLNNLFLVSTMGYQEMYQTMT